jgi:hypothetical protein
MAVPWLRFLTAEARFDPRSVHVRFVVGKMAMRQVFLPLLLLFSSVSFIPPLLYTHLHLYMLLLPEGSMGES